MSEIKSKEVNGKKILMVSTYPPAKDGIAHYTKRLESQLLTKINIKMAVRGKDWNNDSFSYVWEIIKKCLTEKSEIVHFQFSYFLFGTEKNSIFFPLLLFFLRALDKKIVITFHDIIQMDKLKKSFISNYTNVNYYSIKKYAIFFFTKIICNLSNKVIVHSNIGKSTLNSNYSIKLKKIEVIPHGIDCTKNSKPIPMFKKKYNNIVTYFGLVKHGKGLEDLLASWKKLNSTKSKLLIIGGKPPTNKNDNCLENLVKLSQNLGINDTIQFCGYVPNNQLCDYLNSTDIFVLPYNEWGEIIASSGALSVIAAYSKPIIATNIPAFFEIKENQAAIIVEPGNVEELTTAIKNILSNQNARIDLANRLKKYIIEYNWEKIADKTVNLYNSI